jgi:hypothetical protein
VLLLVVLPSISPRLTFARKNLQGAIATFYSVLVLVQAVQLFYGPVMILADGGSDAVSVKRGVQPSQPSGARTRQNGSSPATPILMKPWVAIQTTSRSAGNWGGELGGEPRCTANFASGVEGSTQTKRCRSSVLIRLSFSLLDSAWISTRRLSWLMPELKPPRTVAYNSGCLEGSGGPSGRTATAPSSAILTVVVISSLFPDARRSPEG